MQAGKCLSWLASSAWNLGQYSIVILTLTMALFSNQCEKSAPEKTNMKTIAPGRFAKPETCCSPVCFLLPGGTSCVAGQVTFLNGGFTIAM